MKRYFLLAAATFALAACNNDDNYNNVDDPVAAHITATIGESAVTRASGTSWDAGDQIGITMDDRYVNMEYTTESTDGKFTGTTMYFKNKREPVTLIAYYPFAGEEGTAQTSITASTTADRQTPKNQPKIDFLYATKENVTGSDPNVNLTFSHKMSKLTFTFKEGNKGTNVGKITSYEIGGLVLDGTFNAVTGVCAAKSDAAAAPLRITMP
ncbi:MAG: fimbrillin family protein, partial [Bacteroidaceae bacterium]|nr:fimbrillin family protein [Bacteroidaceae bacterium]